jgi:diguanylate cyclase (GGDEF)-like protein
MLRELSNTDALTGLANRRALDDTLAREFSLAHEQGRDLTLLMFDIDHFKKFNDSYGHDQGDRVLKVFAATVRSYVRDVLDTVCRYGGEEFMVIARETSQEGGMILAERIREGVEAMVVDGLRVTTSIGVAGIRETGAATGSELIERADSALYEAKRGGRNRVVAAVQGDAA